VERCHEAKEEEALFPALARHGLVREDAVRTAGREHDEGQRMLTDLRPVRARQTIEPAVGSLLGSYVGLKRRHIALEEASVLPRHEHGLSAAEDAHMLQEFDRIEKRAVGAGGRAVLLALAGSLSEACRKLVATPPGNSRLTAQDLIRPPQGTIGPDDSLARAAELMAPLGIRELAVVQEGRLVGMLTSTDMEPHRGHLEWTVVRTAMTPDPVTVAPDTSIGAVARLLLGRGFNSVPVSTGRGLIGLVRRSDLLRLLADDETR
jgi:predicted transcriptional regulator